MDYWLVQLLGPDCRRGKCWLLCVTDGRFNKSNVFEDHANDVVQILAAVSISSLQEDGTFSYSP